MSDSYLLPGLPAPVPAADGLDAPYWEGLKDGLLKLQQCDDCGGWQWGPEWICHHCHSDNLSFNVVEPRGTIYSYERVWHPVHPALKEQGPYLIVLVEIQAANSVRVVGNLLGDSNQSVTIGDEVIGVFEHHHDADPSFSLLQWQLASAE